MSDDTEGDVTACDSVTSLRVRSRVSHLRRSVMFEGVETFLRDIPAGIYLLEQRDDSVVLLRLSEGEPDDAAYDPAALWPLLLPPES